MRATYGPNAAPIKLYLHLDENLTGSSRNGSVTVTTDGGAEKTIHISQLPAIPVGRFGYKSTSPTDDSIYDAMLYTEQLYEFEKRPTYIGTGTQFTLSNAIYNGRLSAKSVFDWTEYSTASLFDYQNTLYQAINYCAHKNRITSSSNLNTELKWYLPSQAQLLGMWLSYESYKNITTSNFIRSNVDTMFWSSTNNEGQVGYAQYMNFKFGNLGHYEEGIKLWARCVRDSTTSGSMIDNGPVIDFEKGMPEGSYTTSSKGKGGGDELSDNNKTLYKKLRVALDDYASGVVWDIDACQGYSESSVTGSWRLPTQRELQAIWILQSEIKDKVSAFTLLADDYYWSATDAKETLTSGIYTNAWTIFGSRATPGASGNAPHQHKVNSHLRVRCVNEVTP
jgi:hypothetical protein